MTDVLLAVGTRKGLFIGRQAAAAALGVRRAALQRAGGLLGRHRHPRRPAPAAAGRRGQRALGPVGVPLRRPRARPGPSRQQPAVKFPQDTGASLERVWQLQPGRRRRAGRGVRGHGAGRAVPLRGRRRDASSSSARCGSTRRARSGCRAAAARACTRSSPTRGTRDAVTVAVSTGRGVPHRGRRRELGAVQPRGVGGVPARTRTRSSASACTRSPGTRSTRTGSTCRTTGASTAATTRARSWTDIGDGPARPTSASPWPPTRTAADTAYVFPLNADSDRVPAERRCRVYRTEDAGDELAGAVGRAARGGRTTARCCATRCARTTRTRRASTSATATARCSPAPTTGDSWQQLAGHLPDVLCVRAAVID